MERTQRLPVDFWIKWEWGILLPIKAAITILEQGEFLYRTTTLKNPRPLVKFWGYQYTLFGLSFYILECFANN